MGHKSAKRERKRGKKGRRAHEPAQAAAAAASIGPARDEVEVDLTELASPVAEPPPFSPVTRTKSGYAPRMPEPPRVDDETLTDHLVSLQPLYRETDGKTERASELEVEDLSLRLEGSFLGSPLSAAPAVPARPLATRIARAVGVVFLASSSSFGVWSAVQSLRSSGAPEPARSVVAEARALPPQIVAAPLPRPQPPSVDDAKPDQPQPATEPASASETEPPLPTAVPEPVGRAEPASLMPPRGRALPGREEPPPAASPVAPAPLAAAAPSPVDAEELSPSTAAPVEAAAVAEAALAPEATLPKRPTPAAVRASFGQIRDELSACVGGRQGLVTLRAVIAGSGRVTSGSVEGGFESPEERTCMTRAILELRLPPFQQDVFEIAYPLAL